LHSPESTAGVVRDRQGNDTPYRGTACRENRRVSLRPPATRVQGRADRITTTINRCGLLAAPYPKIWTTAAARSCPVP